MRHARFYPTVLLLALSLTACAAPARQADVTPEPAVQSPTQSSPSITTNTDVPELFNHLQERGITLEEPNESRAAFLYPVPGTAYRLKSGSLFIHPFASVAAAEGRAKQMLPELTPSLVDWIDQPHFYRCKSALVLYLGKDDRVTTALSDFCGPEFAGS